MLHVILIRPGATDFDQQRRVQGTLDVPLNGEGYGEVARLVDQLRGRTLEQVYFADCEQAQETAETIAEALGLKIKRIESLSNLDYGLWQGMRIDEIKRKHPKVYRQWQDHPERVCPPHGETLDILRERVRGAMKKLLKKHKRGTIGVVAPEPLASVVRSYLGQQEVGDLLAASESGHGGWEEIAVEPQLAGSR